MATTRTPTLRLLAAAVLLAVATAATWFAWLGWDDEYQVDPVTGDASGPYEAWQVLGCAATLLVLGLVVGIVVSPWLLAVVPPVFTAVWTLDAAGADDSGLFLVGAVLVLVGTSLGAGVVVLVAFVVRALRRPRVPSTVGG